MEQLFDTCTQNEGCGVTMTKVWDKLVGVNSPVHFRSYIFRQRFVNSCQLKKKVTTVSEFMNNDEYELHKAKYTSVTTQEFVLKLKKRVRKGPVAITMRTWDEMEHCYVLIRKEKRYYVVDSYIDVHEPEWLLFSFKRFQKFLEKPSVERHNTIFHTNDDPYPVRGFVSLVIAYK